MTEPTAIPASAAELHTARGHAAAFITIFIWGTTFISTKVLLNDFQPLEILFFRFFIGYAALWAAAPRLLKLSDRRRELTFMAAGLCGVTLYFLLENFALTFTLAANVGVIISIAPFFTALFDWLLLHGQRPGLRFMAGFVLAMTGIWLIGLRSVSGAVQLNPAGDILAVTAAVVWAVYSTLTKKISGYGYATVESTRRTFFYGLLFMIPALFFFPFELGPSRFADPKNLLNILFLGLGASALCFVTWNLAVRILGPVRTSVYIYMVPVITVVTSVLILHERITLMAVVGIVLTLLGLILSEGKFRLPAKGKAGRSSEGEIGQISQAEHVPAIAKD